MSILKSAPRKIWSFLNVINSIVPKNDKKIFLYSNMGFRDNVRAVYDYLIENGYNREYRIICSLNDCKNQKPQKNVKFVSNVMGLFSFFSSGHAFYCFGKYPVKPRRGQTVFNLWHGMPLKKIGNMVEGFENTDYNYFTHVLCTSEFFRDTMKKSFSCNDEQIVICGQPRTDEMMRYVKSGRDEKILLWLPTFRQGRSDELDILSTEQMKELELMCERYGWRVIIKLHPLSGISDLENMKRYEYISIMSQKELEEKNISLYTLLGASDCLITDYSSVYFDYLLVDRPIGFAVGDMSEYANERGFTFKNPCEYMSGALLSDGKEMLAFIEDVMNGKDDFSVKRHELNVLFNKYCDDENCKRVVEISGIRKNK